MDHNSLVMENLAAQRNAALDQLAIRLSDLSLALERISELEKQLKEKEQT